MHRMKIYPLGASRLKKTLPALKQEFEIIQSDRNPVPSKYRNIGSIRKAGTLSRMVAPIIRHQDELVVITYSFGNLSLIVGELCNRLGVPFLVRIRGGMGGDFRDRAYTSGQMGRLSSLYAVGKKSQSNIIFSRADGILPISKHIRDQFFSESTADIHPNQVYVVGNPLDVERFDTAPTGQLKQALDIPADDHLAITITNFNYQDKFNGVRYFMPAIGRVLASHPDWHIAVVGGGAAVERGHREILSAAPEEVLDRIHLTGFWSPIESALADAEIAFHLSYRDSAPMAVLEAQAACTPIIVNDAGGMKELVDDSDASSNISTIVSRPEDIERPFEALIEDPTLREEIGEQSRQYLEREFSAATIGDEFREAIEGIMRNSAR